MATIFALNYKNYLNRFADKEATLADYLAKDPSYFMQANVNFKLGDGVNTYQIIATNNEYNYLLVTEGDSILSRWYIMDSTYITKNQSRLTLLRDVVVDSWAALKDAPIYVDKGWVDAQNPLIFNTEGVGFNQIKKAEILLKDETKCPWIVAYVGKDSNGKLPTDGIKGTASNTNPEYDEAVTSLTDWEYYNYCNLTENRQTFYVSTYNTKYEVYAKESDSSYVRKFTYNDSAPVDSVGTIVSDTGTTCRIDEGILLRGLFITTYRDQLNSQRMGQINAKPNSSLPALLNQDGKILRVGETAPYTYYRISVTGQSKTIDGFLSAGSMYNIAKAWIESAGGTNVDDKCFRFITDTISYEANLEDITTTVSASFTYTTEKQTLSDAPYTMVVAPYIDATMHFEKDGMIEQFPLTKSIQMEAMSNFVYNGQSFVYDYQLLPYCPIAGISAVSDAQGTDMYVSNPAEKTYSFINDSSGSHYGIVFYAQYSKFSKSIPMSSNTDYDYLTKVETDSIERKVKNECDLVRIASPNGSNSFDFNPQMNDGFDYIQVDCTYKPYSPYIHVAPDFAGLYGDNFGDTRGLIVQGDFSLPTLTSQWKEYEINNKNYANVFDRETQSLEFQEEKRRTQAVVGVISGTVTGAVSGAATGALIGGGKGAIAGTIVGTAASLGAGLTDYHIAKELYAEQMSLRSDRFNYSLDNIKARPNGLAKTSAFTNNNKIFPFLEFYTATDTEKEALRQKIRYEGMKLGVVGTIRNYGNGPKPHTYFRGTLIRLENYNADYHFIQALTNELMMGIFVPLEE